MKKLYLGFILLLGSLAFIPQRAFADLIKETMFEGKKQGQKDINKNVNNEYECILNKKKIITKVQRT